MFSVPIILTGPLLNKLYGSRFTPSGPKHSTSMPFSLGLAVAYSVDMKEGPSVPKPSPPSAVKRLSGPQKEPLLTLRCSSRHTLAGILPLSNLQMVNPLMSPVTLQVKVKVSSGQVGGAGVNCPATSPGEK